MENKGTPDKHIPISYANSYFKVVPINDKVATVRPASLGEILKWKTLMREASSARARAFVCKESNMIVIPRTVMRGRYPQFDFNSWSDLYAYAVSQVNVDLVYDEFIEAIREALPDYSAMLDGKLDEETEEVLEGKHNSPETLGSSIIELSEDDIKKLSKGTKKALEGKRTSWSDLCAYAVSRVNFDLVYDEFIEAVREALPEYSATIYEELSGGTKETLEGKRTCPETLESSGIELSEEEIKLEVSEDVDELINQLMDITTSETISEVLSLINSTCNQEHDVLSIDWEIVELDSVFRLDLAFEIVKRGFKKPSMLKTMNFFPLICSLYD